MRHIYKFVSLKQGDASFVLLIVDLTLAFLRQAIQKEGRFFNLAKMGSYVDLVDQPWQTVAFVEAASTAALIRRNKYNAIL